ncbi:MAG: DUF3775 domain-containing protein [Pseudomonadota bacterium]
MVDISLTVNPDDVRVLIVKARQINAKEAEVISDPGSNDADDGMASVLQIDPENDATRQEIASYITGMNVDEQADLLALSLIGRGDYDVLEFADARAEIENIDIPIARYLLGMPMLGDFLDEGLNTAGIDGGGSEIEEMRGGDQSKPGADEIPDTFERTAGGDGR